MKTIFLNLFIVAFSYFNALSQQVPVVLTDDGAWCWFSDPRAVYISGKDGQLVTGFVTESGSVAALQYHLRTGAKQLSILYDKLEVDDHNNPAFLQRSDGKLLAFYTRHHNTDLYMNRSTLPGDASVWEPAEVLRPNGKADIDRFGDNKYTYANPFMLSEENNRIYLFGRWTGFKPNITWSDDGGTTWTDSRVVVSPQPFDRGQRPYVKYFSDGKDKIHMVFTDGHPQNETFNSVYYACYFKGGFYKTGDELICAIDQLPFEPKDAALVYDAQKGGGRAWVFDMAADQKGNPFIAYARYPSETEHIYHYAWFDGDKWNDSEVCHSGKWFPQTPPGEKEREPYYSGGMTIDPHHPHTLFISREADTVFEIEKWMYNPVKNTWLSYPVTQKSKSDQIRPYVVKNSPVKTGSLLLWLSVDRYIHYTDYRNSVKLLID